MLQRTATAYVMQRNKLQTLCKNNGVHTEVNKNEVLKVCVEKNVLSFGF